MPTQKHRLDGETVPLRMLAVMQARARAQQEAWMWRYHTGTARDGWREHAACRGMSIDWFYSDLDKPQKPPAHVLAICTHCPVRVDCGRACVEEEHAVDPNSIHGMRAGMPAGTRWQWYKQMMKEGLR